MMKLLNSVSSPEKCMWRIFICKVFVPMRWDNACLSSHRLKFEISSNLEAVKNSKLSQYLYSFCDSDSLGASCSMNSVRLESWLLLLSPILLTSYLITWTREESTVTFLFHDLLWTEQAFCFWSCCKQFPQEILWSLI